MFRFSRIFLRSHFQIPKKANQVWIWASKRQKVKTLSTSLQMTQMQIVWPSLKKQRMDLGKFSMATKLVVSWHGGNLRFMSTSLAISLIKSTCTIWRPQFHQKCLVLLHGKKDLLLRYNAKHLLVAFDVQSRFAITWLINPYLINFLGNSYWFQMDGESCLRSGTEP